MLGELSEEARHHADQENWGQYRNVRYDTAEHVREEGNWKRAGFLYLEVLIFDLQGVAGTAGDDEFHQAYSAASPAVVKELARFALQHEIGEPKMKTLYDRVAEQVWMDRFPRSRDEVWTELWEEVQAKKDAIRLAEKEASLGTDQLFSEEEAKAFIRSKNAYELIRRIETLLEKENPFNIPSEKEERAEMYLAALNPESYGDRWKAKIYRRGGEVMLSRGGKKKALEYLERALEAADQDDCVEVKRIMKRLRPQQTA